MAEKKKGVNPFSWFSGKNKNSNVNIPVSPIDILSNSFSIQNLINGGSKRDGKNFKEEERILDYLFHQINPNILQRDEYYKLIKGLRTNEPLFGAAVKIYLAESLTPSVGKSSTLEVTSDNTKLRDDLEKLLDELGIDNDFLYNLYKTILVKGDSFIRLRENKKSKKYTAELIDPSLVRYPLQFTLSEILNDPSLTYATSLLTYLPSNLLGKVNSAEGLKKFIMNWYKKNEQDGFTSTNFDLGTILIDGTYLAPWECIRARDIGSEMVYFPFSECFLHNVISPALDFSQKKLLHTVTRMANIPVEKWVQKEKVGRRPEESEIKAMALANKLTGSLLNQEQYVKDSGVGRRVFVPDDWDFEMISPNLNVDEIADVEFAQKEVAIAARIPLPYLLSDDFVSSSGTSLVRQHKPFRDGVVMFQLGGVRAITKILEIVSISKGLLKDDDKFTLTAYLPPLEDGEEGGEVSAKLDDYLAFLEKVAVISGAESVADIDNKTKLRILDDLYKGKNKDTVYSIISSSLKGTKPSDTGEPVTLASITGSTSSQSMKEMLMMKKIIEGDKLHG